MVNNSKLLNIFPNCAAILPYANRGGATLRPGLSWTTLTWNLPILSTDLKNGLSILLTHSLNWLKGTTLAWNLPILSTDLKNGLSILLTHSLNWLKEWFVIRIPHFMGELDSRKIYVNTYNSRKRGMFIRTILLSLHSALYQPYELT